MRQEKSVEDFRHFVNWALARRDLDFLDDLSRFLHKLYIFSQMRFGGNEYVCQLEQMQNAAHRLVRSAEKLDSCSVPISLHVVATMSRKDRAVLDVARLYAPVASEALELPELDLSSISSGCSDSSLPPA